MASLMQHCQAMLFTLRTHEIADHTQMVMAAGYAGVEDCLKELRSIGYEIEISTTASGAQAYRLLSEPPSTG